MPSASKRVEKSWRCISPLASQATSVHESPPSKNAVCTEAVDKQLIARICLWQGVGVAEQLVESDEFPVHEQARISSFPENVEMCCQGAPCGNHQRGHDGYPCAFGIGCCGVNHIADTVASHLTAADRRESVAYACEQQA